MRRPLARKYGRPKTTFNAHLNLRIGMNIGGSALARRESPTNLHSDYKKSTVRLLKFYSLTPKTLQSNSKNSTARLIQFYNQTPQILQSDSKKCTARLEQFYSQTPTNLQSDFNKSTVRLQKFYSDTVVTTLCSDPANCSAMLNGVSAGPQIGKLQVDVQCISWSLYCVAYWRLRFC